MLGGNTHWLLQDGVSVARSHVVHPLLSSSSSKVRAAHYKAVEPTLQDPSPAFLPRIPPRDSDRQVTLLELLHWLSLKGGGVGGTTEILLPRRNTRIMGYNYLSHWLTDLQIFEFILQALSFVCI